MTPGLCQVDNMMEATYVACLNSFLSSVKVKCNVSNCFQILILVNSDHLVNAEDTDDFYCTVLLRKMRSLLIKLDDHQIIHSAA